MIIFQTVFIYLFETDENGVPYAMGETHTEQDRTYKCVVGDGSGDF